MSEKVYTLEETNRACIHERLDAYQDIMDEIREYKDNHENYEEGIHVVVDDILNIITEMVSVYD